MKKKGNWVQGGPSNKLKIGQRVANRLVLIAKRGILARQKPYGQTMFIKLR